MKTKTTLTLRRSGAEAVGPERLQKLLSKAGLGSRRAIEERILREEIQVDNRPAKIGDSLADGQTIKVDGREFVVRAVAHTGPRVLAYNKPEGEVTTAHDPEGRATVFDRLPRLKGSRWIAVGRLDLNTAGLLLFTTDGELANRLMHPSREIDREYLCRVHGDVDVGAIHQLTHGVTLEDGPAKFEELEALSDEEGEGSNRWYRVLLREGRQREVRRLWEAVGAEVSRLKRVRYGPIELGKDLKRGWYRELAAEEIEVLLRAVELPVTTRSELRIVPVEAAHKFDRGQRRERRPPEHGSWRREADESIAERGSRARPERSRDGQRFARPAGDRPARSPERRFAEGPNERGPRRFSAPGDAPRRDGQPRRDGERSFDRPRSDSRPPRGDRPAPGRFSRDSDRSDRPRNSPPFDSPRPQRDARGPRDGFAPRSGPREGAPHEGGPRGGAREGFAPRSGPREGAPRSGPREGGPRGGAREGFAPRSGPREGGPRSGPREGGPRGGAREGFAPRSGPREGAPRSGPREGFAPRSDRPARAGGSRPERSAPIRTDSRRPRDGAPRPRPGGRSGPK
jgi:23S rRNA pseudouridine2605 synthase